MGNRHVVLKVASKDIPTVGNVRVEAKRIGFAARVLRPRSPLRTRPDIKLCLAVNELSNSYNKNGNHAIKQRIEVLLVENDTKTTEGSEQFIVAEMVLRHPKYDYYTMDNDIMLIKLSQPAAINSYADAVSLQTAFRGDQLQCLDAPVMSEVDCHGSYPGMITDNMMCVGYKGRGRDSCQTDPGGPVVCNGVLQGIESGGTCVRSFEHPGFYTRVCHYVYWIHSTIAAN
ncbi:trypsin-like [Amblyraja radiata]|uniref:trypsin-like n=1 Tax=Amblyraja radiata TaxID=386614 RepID=UPI0014031F15|nr:trypsin-like [Amblyraja radiata]